MKPDDYAKVRSLYDQVIDLPTNERLVRLRGLSADTHTIGEVMALITAAEVETFAHISKPLATMLGSMNAPELKPGDSLGVWRIEREIGQGGMGSVFLVERQDGHFTQTAALKFVKGLPRADTLSFFTRERQLLATLTHPNIARLLDGGATAEGQPYLVMEYIDGVAIDIHCKQQQLTAPQILALFTTACEAVAFAHQQLIVHCDLKPSNLLINKVRRPILLDFGIARLVDRVGADVDVTSEPSAAANMSPYTPRYASPEQRARGVVSTVSDIYSLGVMLGELLGANATQDMELAAILKKATARSPENRYATVVAFTDDIARTGRKQPVLAMPQTLAYVSRKFLQRRWPLVVVGVAFMVMAGGFTQRLIAESQRSLAAEQTAVSERNRAAQERDRAIAAESQALAERDATKAAQTRTVYERDRATEAERTASRERNLAVDAAVKAKRERDRARQAERASGQTSDFLVSIFEGSNPNSEIRPISAAVLLKQAEERLERQLQGQPATQSDIYAALAKVQTNIGDQQAAKAHYARALAYERTQQRPLKLAAILYGSATLSLRAFGNTAAEGDVREALALREKYTGPVSIETAESLVQLGLMLSVAGKTEEANACLTRAVSIYRTAQPASAALAAALAQLGMHQSRQGQHEQAIATLRENIRIREVLAGQKMGDAEYGDDLQLLARALSSAQKFSESESLYRRAITDYRNAYGEVSQPLGWAQAELARMLMNSGRALAALPLFDEALPIIEKTLGARSPSFGVINNNAAGASERVGDVQAANERYSRAIAVLEPIWSEFDLSHVRHQYGLFLLKINNIAAARRQIEPALHARQIKLGNANPETRAIQLSMVRLYLQMGEQLAAAPLLASLIEQQSSLPYAQAAALAREVAASAALQGRTGDMRAALDRAEKLDRERWGENDERYLLATADRAELMIRWGDQVMKAQGIALIDPLVTQLSPLLIKQAPLLERLNALRAQ